MLTRNFIGQSLLCCFVLQSQFCLLPERLIQLTQKRNDSMYTDITPVCLKLFPFTSAKFTKQNLELSPFMSPNQPICLKSSFFMLAKQVFWQQVNIFVTQLFWSYSPLRQEEILSITLSSLHSCQQIAQSLFPNKKIKTSQMLVCCIFSVVVVAFSERLFAAIQQSFPFFFQRPDVQWELSPSSCAS